QVGKKYADDGVPGFFFKSFPETKFPEVACPFGLELAYSGVTDARLKEIAHLKNLTVLTLWHTKVTDAGLKEVALHTNLVSLELTNTKVTDAGLYELAPLKKLTALG